MEHYFHNVRREIRPHITTLPTRVLDVDCGAGVTLRWIKSFSPETETVGLELNPDVSEELRNNADVAIITSAEDDWASIGTFDLILLLDVLEHLTQPEKLLDRLTGMLRDNGLMIVSLPNVAHYSVVLPLLFKRQFTYRDAGIMDRTHMRFFVEDTAVGLLNDAGLTVDKGLVLGPQGPKSRAMDLLTGGMLRPYLTKQYVMRARKSPQAPQPRIRWDVMRTGRAEDLPSRDTLPS